MSEKLSFNLELKEKPVELAKDGIKTNYFLREMTGVLREKYLDSVGKRVKYDANGKAVGFKSYEGMHADLLAYCFYDEAGNSVSRQEIQNFPSNVLTSLFEAAQEINQLGEISGETKNG